VGEDALCLGVLTKRLEVEVVYTGKYLVSEVVAWQHILKGGLWDL